MNESVPDQAPDSGAAVMDPGWWSRPAAEAPIGASPGAPASAHPTAQPDAHPAPPNPWLSQPDAGFRAPYAGAVPPVEPPPRSGGGRLMLALALLAGALAGGTTAALVDRSDSTAGPAVTGALGGGAAGITTATGALPAVPAVRGTPEAAAAAIGPSVVTVEVTGQGSQDPLTFADQQISDTGSGVVLRSDGFILTNNHVIAAAQSSGSVAITFSDGRTLPARIVGHDSTSDLAVIKAEVTGLRAATFADSNRLVVGQSVLAVGAPLGLSNTVTQGIVSTLHRPVATGEAGVSAQSVIDAVQTDAAINPGNSGGALVDLAGRVVGINSAIATTGGSSGGQSGNIGVGFAIPSDDAVKVATQLIATGRATHAQMGVSVGSAASATTGAPGLGAVIRDVVPAGPAARAGLQAGDVVTRIDDRRITDANSLIVAIRSHDPGSVVTVSFHRGGATRTVSVTLTGAPSA